MPEGGCGQGCRQGGVEPGTAGRQSRVLLVPSPVLGTLVPSRRLHSDGPPCPTPARPHPHPHPCAGRPGRLALPVPAWCRRDVRFTVGFKGCQEGFHLE